MSIVERLGGFWCCKDKTFIWIVQGFWKKVRKWRWFLTDVGCFGRPGDCPLASRNSLLYLASIDDEGNISKPFLLPQENPWQFYHSSVFSYNVPDFTCDKVEFDVNGAYDEVFCDKKQQATVR